jgi:hypothetical protein
MDNNYAYNPPAVVKKPFFLQKQILIPGVFLVLIAAVVIIFAVIIGGADARKRTAAETLHMRMGGIMEVLTDYQPYVRNSVVRSNVAALKNSLSNTYRDLGLALPEIGVDLAKPTEKIVSSESAHITRFEGILEEARLNANLDRVLVRELSFEISLLITLENDLSIQNTDESLHAALSVSRSDLIALGRTFQSLANNPDL